MHSISIFQRRIIFTMENMCRFFLTTYIHVKSSYLIIISSLCHHRKLYRHLTVCQMTKLWPNVKQRLAPHTAAYLVHKFAMFVKSGSLCKHISLAFHMSLSDTTARSLLRTVIRPLSTPWGTTKTDVNNIAYMSSLFGTRNHAERNCFNGISLSFRLAYYT